MRFPAGGSCARQQWHGNKVTQIVVGKTGLRYVTSVRSAQSFKPHLLDAVERLFIQELTICEFIYGILEKRLQIARDLNGEPASVQLKALVEMLEILSDFGATPAQSAKSSKKLFISSMENVPFKNQKTMRLSKPIS